MSLHLDPDKCLGCSACVVHCPVAEATSKFLGPRLMGPAMERFRLLGVADDPSLTYCANCKNCEIACPHNVPIATLNMLARQKQAQKTPPSFRDWVCAHGETIARYTKYVPSALKNFSVGLSPMRMALDLFGIAKDCPMPKFAATALRDSVQSYKQEKKDKKVLFFPGCYVNYYDPGTGYDLIWLLNQAGYEVLVPKEFVCCGVPLISGGFFEDAKKTAQANIEVIAKANEEKIPVLTLCPSCRLQLTHEYGAFFPELLPKQEPLKVEDAEAFLLDCISKAQLTLPTQASNPISCIYHAPCHLRAQGEGLPGVELLQMLPTVQLSLANAGCCGISGSYGFKKEKYHIGQSVGARLFQTIKESNAIAVATECGTCRLQIQGATNVPAIHPVTFLRATLEGRPLSL